MATDDVGNGTLGRSTCFYAAVSTAAALLTVGLKAAAYLLTGSGDMTFDRPGVVTRS